MKKKFKSKLIPYTKKIKSYIGSFDIQNKIKLDKNLKLLEVASVGEKTIYWIRGFGERGVFFLKSKTNKYDKRGEYYYLEIQSIEIESFEMKLGV